jgi:hypothetical protein
MEDGPTGVNWCSTKPRTHGTYRSEEFRNGTPLFRAKDQSWRDAEATVAIVAAIKLTIMTAVITSEVARLFVEL